ncbi:hypothetical protein MSAN_02261900 [Mycena sanguinolenta]|uniref:Uncharacterized protein n=1 Tax=Mycena sanguinolenta TaxID=230812 RepID=A0A8H7CH99_9AGAR|nr:hypothetical protein MSAN_02261900 [Mycena sanguinolenta]
MQFTRLLLFITLGAIGSVQAAPGLSTSLTKRWCGGMNVVNNGTGHLNAKDANRVWSSALTFCALHHLESFAQIAGSMLVP